MILTTGGSSEGTCSKNDILCFQILIVRSVSISIIFFSVVHIFASGLGYISSKIYLM